jgi:hypothetical protein
LQKRFAIAKALHYGKSVAALKFARTCGGHLLPQVSAVSRSKASFIKAGTLGINNYPQGLSASPTNQTDISSVILVPPVPAFSIDHQGVALGC